MSVFAALLRCALPMIIGTGRPAPPGPKVHARRREIARAARQRERAAAKAAAKGVVRS